MENKRGKRRSLLYVPGSSEKMICKALTLKADAIIFDLEDAVRLDQKEKARTNICKLFKEICGESRPLHSEIIVRINAFDSAFALEDICQIGRYMPNTILIPKADKRKIVAADIILSMLELQYGFPKQSLKMIILVETAEGVETIYEMIQSSERITGVQFGAEDFTRDMEIVRTSKGEELIYSRNRLAIACHACKIDCIDTPYTDFKDIDGCVRDTQFAKSIGMTGRCVIHPSLIELTNGIFSPSLQEIADAERIVSAFDEAAKNGFGAVALDGKMIDLPVVQRAKKRLEKA